MSRFQTSDFAALLDELIATRGEAGTPPPASPTIDYLSVVEELHSGRIAISPRHAAAEYGEGGSRIDLSEDVPAAAPVLVFPDTRPDAVARELALTGAENPAELDALRRRFALDNHPDCVVPELREHAMTRMQIANMLIDDAKKKAAPRVRRT